jgi:hypothetical protein
MNSLSWLLYMADVLPSLAGFVVFVGSLAGIASAFAWVIGGINAKEIDHDGELRFPGAVWVRDSGPRMLATSIFVIVLGLLVPTTNTFYMIAGSQAGQVVVESEEAQELFDRMERLIDQQLDAYEAPE